MKKGKSIIFVLVIAILAAACFAAAFPMRAEAYSSSGKLKKPVIKSLKKADNGFTVTSRKNSKVKGYQIRYSTTVDFKKSKYKRAAGSKLDTTISGLQEYKRYYVRIRSYKIVKGKRKYSDWSKWKRVTTAGKPFDGYNAYTKYAETTLYKSRSVISRRITLWYNSEVYVAGVRKIAGVKWIRVYYKGSRYYIPATSLSQKLKKEPSQYVYFGRTELENEVLAKAMDVYLNWPTRYDNTHKADIGSRDSSGRYPLDCSALVACVLNGAMQKYCPAYNVSRGVPEEYYTDALVNGGISGQEFRVKTVCTGKPVLSQLRPGDILFFRQSGGYPIDHVGIYLGNGEFMQSNRIYSRYPGDKYGGVNIAPLMRGKYYSYFKYAKRFIPQNPDEFKTLNKVLVRTTDVTVYSDVKCTVGNEKALIEVPDEVAEIEVPVKYIGNRYYDDKTVYRCAYVEYEDSEGQITNGFVRISDKSVIRDPKPADAEEQQTDSVVDTDTDSTDPSTDPGTNDPSTDPGTNDPSTDPTDQATDTTADTTTNP